MFIMYIMHILYIRHIMYIMHIIYIMYIIHIMYTKSINRLNDYINIKLTLYHTSITFVS